MWGCTGAVRITYPNQCAKLSKLPLHSIRECKFSVEHSLKISSACKDVAAAFEASFRKEAIPVPVQPRQTLQTTPAKHPGITRHMPQPIAYNGALAGVLRSTKNNPHHNHTVKSLFHALEPLAKRWRSAGITPCAQGSAPAKVIAHPCQLLAGSKKSSRRTRDFFDSPVTQDPQTTLAQRRPCQHDRCPATLFAKRDP